MTTTTYNIQENLVKDLRKIRDKINDDIKDMSFEEECAYLDKLLADSKNFTYAKSDKKNPDKSRHQQ